MSSTRHVREVAATLKPGDLRSNEDRRTGKRSALNSLLRFPPLRRRHPHVTLERALERRPDLQRSAGGHGPMPEIATMIASYLGPKEQTLN